MDPSKSVGGIWMNTAISRQYLDAVTFVGEQIDLVVIHEVWNLAGSQEP